MRACISHDPGWNFTIGVQYFSASTVHALGPMPEIYKKLPTKLRPKGVSNRNTALKWIFHQNLDESKDISGVIYFADDDNTYDVRIFEEVLL